MNAYKLSDTEKDFVERRGLMAEDDGQPRILGRIWGLLMVVGVPISSSKIAELLAVSRGSVSTNLKLLEIMDIIKKSTKTGERETYYSMAPQPYSSLISMYCKRIQANLKMIEETMETIKRPEAKERMKDMATFYRLTLETNKELHKKLEAKNPA